MSKQSQVTDPVQAPERAGTGSPHMILAILSLAAFMASLDVFIVNVAFDKIGESFEGSSLGDVSRRAGRHSGHRELAMGVPGESAGGDHRAGGGRPRRPGLT
ncbi:hypothetical protein PV336_04580 [Streptomyces sp. MI02-2A]|uniref:hypothetical protein n=1 Tax=unclassified Streptomyces TaxID=2593676 RepID=UPI0018FEB850|nr:MULTISPECIES: hypothetical protein [unclassified Streptomyces]MDX3258512.1 hypothetical protein [Streptomyces sp. MI02-2A]